MAILEMDFDPTQVEPSVPFEVIPAGQYHVQIVRSEFRDTKSGTGRFLWLELAIIDGPYANRRLFDRLNLVNQSEDAVRIAKSTLGAICHAVGQMSLRDTEELHHKSMLAVVKLRQEAPDKDGFMRPASNEISGYKALNGSQPATVGGAGPAKMATAKPPGGSLPWKRTPAS